MVNSHSEDDCHRGSVAFTQTATLGCWRLSLLHSLLFLLAISSLHWNLFLPLLTPIHSNKSKWEWVRSLMTSCMGVKLWVTPPLLTPLHTHAHIQVLVYLWDTPYRYVSRLTQEASQGWMDTYHNQGQQSYLVYSFMLSPLSYWKSIATCCEVKPAT